MKDALESAVQIGIHRLILALEERGFIRRLPNRARALEVLRLPESLDAPRRPRGGFSPRRDRGQSGPGAPAAARDADEADPMVAVPVMDASPPARRSPPRSIAAATTSPCPPTCSAPASISPSKCAAIR